jgi:hypothetical protein
MNPSACPCPRPPSDRLRVAFLAILQRLKAHSHAAFRRVRCPHRRADQVAEAVAWLWFPRLARRGEDASRFPASLALFAAHAVRGGRRLAGLEPPRDVLSPSAQRRHDFAVGSLVEGGCPESILVEEAQRGDARTPVPEHVSFRPDFPPWLRRRSRRDRRLVRALLQGGQAREVARWLGLSPARVSQVRRELYADWTSFLADPADARAATPKPAVAAHLA